MLPLTGSGLLRVWEVGERQHPIDRALTLLGTALPEMAWEELAALSIGQRDSVLIALRAMTFGSMLDGLVRCTQCNSDLEFAIQLAELRALDSAVPAREAQRMDVNGISLGYRLPNSTDLAAIVSAEDPQAARDLLVRRCVSDVRQGESELPVDELPEYVISALAQRMEEEDPLADIRIDLTCTECGNQWPVALDIVSFLWSEISGQAKRLLYEVDTLAHRYGWREEDILAMSSHRRNSYLDIGT